MSSSRGSGAGNGGGAQPIPAGSRKIVQSLKEIVKCSETEIYAALKECNMDPNEAVNRLLSQDPFHEVKSKREKKKEGKDGNESRSRAANNSSYRGGKTGADRYLGRGGSTPYNASESALLHGRSTYKKDNGSTAYTNYFSSAHGVSENNKSRGPPVPSDGVSAENKVPSLGTTNGTPSGIQSSGYQSSWVGVPGQVSMADIVKRGRPQNKALNAPNVHNNVQGSSADAHHYLRFSDDHASKAHESEFSSIQHVAATDEWPSIEKPAAPKVNPIPQYHIDPEVHAEATGVHSDHTDQSSGAEEALDTEDDDVDDSGSCDVGSHSISSRKIPEDDSGSASLSENNLYNDMGSYQHPAHDFERIEGEDGAASVSVVTRNMQQLGVTKEGGMQSEVDAPSVVIPDHLQVHTADCSHLSFGSFGSGMSATYSSGNMASAPVKTNVEEPRGDADISSVGHPDNRGSEYYVDDSLRNTSDGSLFHRTGATPGSYEASSASQPEELKPESADGTRGSQYPFPASNPGYSFDDSQHLNASFSQTSSQTQNLAAFSNVMSYSNSLPSTLLAAHPGRESELQYSPFPSAQSVSAKYGNSVSSIDGSAVSMSEALKTAGFSSMQPGPQTLSGTSIATGPPLPQHLAVHPYSQPTLPLGPFTNMFGYPFLPQSYTYMPSAFQQTFAGNSTYHQSLAASLPQYKSSVSVSSLPQSAAVASGYGAFGNTTTVPGNFPMNPPTAPSGTALNYDDLLSSQYKDNSHLISLQQNENSAMWLHGPNSRTMSAVPAGNYYNYQGQNQQPGGFRQAQQPSQNYSALGYPNLYHSQAALSLDQQQNPRDGSLGGSQGQPKQSQLWQNSY